MPLIVISDFPHFAPSVENVTLRYTTPAGKRVDVLTLDITDQGGTLIFQKLWDPTQGVPIPPLPQYIWDGENNQAAPVLDSAGLVVKQFVNPLGSPYSVKFTATLTDTTPSWIAPVGVSINPGIRTPCRVRPRALATTPPDDGNAVQDGTTTVNVFYRQIQLEPMDWLDAYKAVSLQGDGSFPAAASDDIKKMWFQYKLNELGYVAGPITNPPQDNPIMRALFRYTQAHPDAAALPKIYTYQTETAGAPGSCAWGWKAAWEARYGTLAALCLGPVLVPGVTLLQKLQANDRPRADVFDKTKLTNQMLQNRVILDHDIFYINHDDNEPDGHADYDQEFLNPFCLPMKVKILLVSRTDADARAPGVDAPAAIGPAQCEWMVFDPPESLAKIPDPVSTDVPNDFKSKTKIYLGNMQLRRAARFTDKFDPQDNCPVDLGGVRGTDPLDVTRRFFAVTNACTSVSPDGKRFYSIANSNLANPNQQLGNTAVFFQGSYIGGDNYVVQVRFSWDNIPNGDALKVAHKGLGGLAKCFGSKKMLSTSESDPFVGQTCRMTIWRRHHVLREISWAENLYPAADWAPIVRNFEGCHVILVPPVDPPIHIENLLPGTARTALAQSLIDGFINFRDATGGQATTNKAWSEFNDPTKNATFHRSAIYPVQLPDFNIVAPPGPTPQARFDAFCTKLSGIRNEWPTYSFLRDFFQKIREEFDQLGKGAGLIILRGALLPRPRATDLPGTVAAAVTAELAAFQYFYRALSAGGDHGIVFLDDCAILKFEETFFLSHEIGHCMFLTHLFNVAGDHDADPNCIMTYNSSNGGESLGWATNPLSVPTTFRLRIDLSANVAGVPNYGQVLSDFNEQDPKTYFFQGDIASCQRAVAGFKFTPNKKAQKNDGSPVPPDTVITIKLQAEQGKLPPYLSVNLPFDVTAPLNGGAVKPFTNITAKAPNPAALLPFFCGKCVLKLRGWRVREDNTRTHTPANAPPRSPVIPVNPKMAFTEFTLALGSYFRKELGNDVEYKMRADQDSVGGKSALIGGRRGWPRGFCHTHRLTWESSDGDPASLGDVETREYVKFLKPTTDKPFNALQDPDQEYTRGGGNWGLTQNDDEHSTCFPAIICCWPREKGTLMAKQWYQWRRGADPWQDIEGAAFLLEKSVFQEGKDWVFGFKKTNLLPENTTPFHFEVHYTIPDPPPNMPDSFAAIMQNNACKHVPADINKWARRVVSLG